MVSIRFVIVICALFLLASCSTAVKISGVHGDNYQKMRHDLDKKIPKLLKKHDAVSMVVMVVDDQNTVYAKGFGYADRDNNIVASPDIAYRIGSISKLFTAIAIMQLHEQGKLDIDAPLHQYLPEFSIHSPYGLEGITLRRMMSHHSGLPSDYEKGFSDYAANRTLLNDLSKDYVAFKPDTVHAYSNLAYGLLGRVIERVSGLSFGEYLQRQIFQPLDMQNAFVGFNDSPTMARAYEGGELQQPVEIRDRAAGDVSMSANDLAVFAKTMLRYTNDTFVDENAVLLSAASVKEMWRPQNDHVVLDGEINMGLGWILSYPDKGLETEKNLVWHNGSTIYFSSSLLINTKQKLAVIVFANSAEADHRLTDDVAKNTLLAAMLSKTGKQPSKYAPGSQPVSEFSEEQAEKLRGRYLSSYMGDFNIAGELDGLRTDVDGMPIRLRPMTDGTVGVDMRLWGFIPIRNKFLRDLRLQPIQYGDEYLIRAVNGPVLAQKVDGTPLPDSWKTFLGRYDLVNPDPLHNKMGMESLLLSEANGFLKGELRAKDDTEQFFLEVVDQHRAKIVGYGRGLGGSALFETDQEGRQVILYSGLKFVKRK